MKARGIAIPRESARPNGPRKAPNAQDIFMSAPPSFPFFRMSAGMSITSSPKTAPIIRLGMLCKEIKEKEKHRTHAGNMLSTSRSRISNRLAMLTIKTKTLVLMQSVAERPRIMHAIAGKAEAATAAVTIPALVNTNVLNLFMFLLLLRYESAGRGINPPRGLAYISCRDS